MTLKSFWQVYTGDASRPFRETNYRPELFYFTPTSWQPLGGSTWLGFGIEHESNGQRQELSRSWNRVYTNLTFAKDNFVASIHLGGAYLRTKKPFRMILKAMITQISKITWGILS